MPYQIKTSEVNMQAKLEIGMPTTGMNVVIIPGGIIMMSSEFIIFAKLKLCELHFIVYQVHVCAGHYMPFCAEEVTAMLL